ncbi:MAG: hypothetical protein H7A27_05960 [Spirochaetaceae bacterium]|nr:hypothetical protein [Spirochaetaceae bacterium]HPE88576.1 hypothetical protein [Spirochaetales bacterium]
MSQTNYVFAIGGDGPVLLHPYDSPETFDSAEPGSVVGRYGSGAAPRDADGIRTALYAAMERGTRRYFLNKGYYLRLAITVATFVAVYLFLSIVVRDPVPLIDELLLGSLSAAAVFFASERRALSSPRHLDAVLRLRREIDGAFFSESRVVDLLEAWRDEALALGPAAFYKAGPGTSLGDEERAEAEALCAALARRWKHKPVVAELYAAVESGQVPGALLDKTVRKLGLEEGALAIAYMRLIPLALGKGAV